jgi:hypothetical protein
MCSSGRKSRALVGLVLALAVALLTVTAAQARVDQGILVPPGKEWVPPTLSNQALREAIEMRRIDARQAGNLRRDFVVVDSGQQSWPGVDPTSGQVYPRYHVSPAVETTTSSFDWRAAGIGAGLALALVVLAGGALLASRHVGREQTA